MTDNTSDLTKKDLEELLRPTLTADGAKIESFSVRHLTKPGDNYGSTMLAVDVKLSPGSRTLPLVAKMLPKSVILQDAFHCEVSVRKETDLYLLVRPAFDRIQKESNVPEDKYLDVIPVCYGARISAKGDSGPVDETSVILQENLKVQGFECGDRLTGLNLAHCKFVIDKLARFHATAVAIKIKKPEEFEKTVVRTATPIKANEDDFIATESLGTLPEYETLKDRINTALLKSWDLFKKSRSNSQSRPFDSLVHADLWTNNIMFQYKQGSSKDIPASLRLVDFQITLYGSPARDLLFFLYSSAKLEVLSEHYDNLIRLYHESFVDCLKILGCDVAPFSFDEFLKEIRYAASVEFVHIAFMLPYVCLDSSDARSTNDMTLEAFLQPKVGKLYSARASKFIVDFASRNWI